MDKQTKLVKEQIFSSHNNNKRVYLPMQRLRKSRNLLKITFSAFDE